MADILVVAMPFHGHALPMSTVAARLVADGHRVRAYSGGAYARTFSDAGAAFVPWRRARDFDEHDLAASYPELRGRKGPLQMLANIEHLFVRTGAAQADDLLDSWSARRWDAVVADALSLGAAFAAERTGAPWLTVSTTPLSLPSTDLPPPGLGLHPARGPAGSARDAVLRAAGRAALGGVQRAYEAERRAAGLGADGLRFDEAAHSPRLVCATGVGELEYPRRDPDGRVAFVGRLAERPPDRGGPERPAVGANRLPSWWPEVRDARVPVVHVTQGTQNLDPDDLIRPALAALGRQQVLVVVTTGREGGRLPFPVPPNARVAGFVPHDDLLPHVDVMITNGGWGGVLAALAHGIPLVVAAGDLDKPEVAARVAWSGAGVDLRTGRPRPRAILEAWRRASSDGAIRSAAARIAASLAEHDGPAEVAAHTLALIGERPRTTG
ncbi:glycosyltransferase [Agromyces arachidis]|uniref:glycosyltransferase n=1 Tax=Agromyces arachidis TaxID=766966 RepID=UPI004055C051